MYFLIVEDCYYVSNSIRIELNAKLSVLTFHNLMNPILEIRIIEFDS